jgi:cell fate regulator YaaT (PSP1 superfamily)
MDKQYIKDTRGNYNKIEETPEKEIQQVSSCNAGCGSNKLDVFNWLEDVPSIELDTDIVEIRFKNTRKGFYKNVNKLRLFKGDIVAVEASPGHDIGIVSLVGTLVKDQMKRAGFTYTSEEEIKKVYRKAKGIDIEKWYQSIEQEHTTMIRARDIAGRLNLNMKIGDVEYQGDKTKAIFYYIADDRVDFRELIKKYAEEFKVRIEMKQIGARQEAGRIGSIGTCGRELCCSTWLSSFVSVTTNSARFQEVSLNPQKLAGQCGKLKCCLNYELKCYLDAQQNFPNSNIPLELLDGTAYHQKTDIFRRIMWYSFSKDEPVNLTAVPVEKVLEIQELNKKGIKVKNLVEPEAESQEDKPLGFSNPIGSDSITRFQENKPFKKKSKKKRNWNGPNANNSADASSNGGKSVTNKPIVSKSGTNDSNTRNTGGGNPHKGNPNPRIINPKRNQNE